MVDTLRLYEIAQEEKHQRCRAGAMDEEYRYPCMVHRGGVFAPGAERCSASPDPFAQAEYSSRAAFQREAAQLEQQLSRLPGRWRLIGHDGTRWTAKGTVGMRSNVEVHSDTSHGLLERVRQRLEPQRGERQGVLL